MKKTLLFTILLTLLLLPALCFGQTGTIAGKVSIQNSGKALPNAAVYLSNAKTGIYTKKNGTFILKNVPAGIQTVTVSMVGYAKQTKEITVVANETVVVNFDISVEAIKLSGISVNATRAKKRETPVAFTDLSQEDVVGKYTTEDVPGLLEGVPGLFSTGGGLGEGELRVRGFDQDKVQIMINGIPVNDPESQQVYWSNWTGLSSNIKSVQVQRGAGSSMYGSGVFGGSVNIETIGATPEQGWTYRTSGGFYSVPDEVADGKGNMIDWTPVNYNMLARYNSGNLYGGKFNYSVMAERKLGESWQIGTDYDGWSFGVDTQHLWGAHSVNMSLIAAPQKHNQMRTSTDLELMDELGRAYNRNNNPEQENYYNKPQFSVRDEWKIDDDTSLMTNLFATTGTGGGKYLKNDLFDVETGRVMYMEVSEYTDNKYFSRHAYDLAINNNIALDGIDIFYNEVDPTIIDSVHFNGDLIDYGYNLPNGDYYHTYENDSQNNHKQFGLNTYLDHRVNDMFKLVVGGEWRWWRATHIAESFDLRYYGGVYAQHQDRYNYDGIVSNLSGFLRAQFQPVDNLTLLLDAQYASYTSSVEENPIQVFDYQLGMFTDNYIYATEDVMTAELDDQYDEVLDENGNPVMVKKFKESDYKKTYDFLSPKAGINYNITQYLNILVNGSIAYKEPKVGDWYNRSSGPDASQVYEVDFVQTDGDTISVNEIRELDPEKATTFEVGIGYAGNGWNFAANVYNTKYEDKIESTLLQNGDYLTVNAGEATHQGIEVDAGFVINNIDANISATYSKNRWDNMNVDEIFGESAEDIIDKVVPFSPEQMINFGLGYTFKLPTGDLRIGFSGNWWDEYYGNYTNEYYTEYEAEDPTDPWSDIVPAESSLTEAKLPYYFALNSDISYIFKIGKKDASIRLDLKSINSRENNYSRASWASDYGRNDNLNGISHMYVTPAPLFHAFLTAEINF